MNLIKIVLADDEELFRKGIAFMLEKTNEFELMHETGKGSDLIEYLHSSNPLPDIVLMDLNMPGLNGVEATKIIHQKHPSVKVIALTSYYSPPFIHNMLQCGASAFLSKNTSPDEMIKTIQGVHKKGYYYSDEILSFVNENMRHYPQKVVSKFDKNYLTKREVDVLLLICQQYSTAEISEKLFISPRTVEGHRNNLLLKTEAKNMIGLVLYALENKMISFEALKHNFLK